MIWKNVQSCCDGELYIQPVRREIRSQRYRRFTLHYIVIIYDYFPKSQSRDSSLDQRWWNTQSDLCNGLKLKEYSFCRIITLLTDSFVYTSWVSCHELKSFVFETRRQVIDRHVLDIKYLERGESEISRVEPKEIYVIGMS